MKYLTGLFMVLSIFLVGCAAPSSSPMLEINAFDNTKTIRSSHATIYHMSNSMMFKAFDIISVQWDSGSNNVLINVSAPGWNNLKSLQFNVDGKLISLEKFDASTRFYKSFDKQLSGMSFSMPLNTLRELYSAKKVMVRLITLDREHFVGDFKLTGVTFDGYVDAYSVIQKFLKLIDENQ